MKWTLDMIQKELEKARRGKKIKAPLEWLYAQASRDDPAVHRIITQPAVQRAFANQARIRGIFIEAKPERRA